MKKFVSPKHSLFCTFKYIILLVCITISIYTAISPIESINNSSVLINDIKVQGSETIKSTDFVSIMVSEMQLAGFVTAGQLTVYFIISSFIFISLIALIIYLFLTNVKMRSYQRESRSYQHELRKLSSVVEQSPASIVITDLNGNIEYVNPKFIELTGYTSEEVRGKNPRILKSGLTSADVYDDMWHSILKGKSWTGEYCNCKKNGELYWESAIISPIMNKEGAITNFVAIKEDITHRKTIENELQESKKDLSHAQSVGHIGNWRIDVVKDQLIWSDETYRIFGFRIGEKLTYETFLTGVHPEDREFVNQSWKNALKNREYDIEHRILCGSEVKWVREKADLEFDENNNLTGAFGITQDITELKRAEEELKASRQWLVRIAETSPDVIFILDVIKNKNVYANRSVGVLLGYTQNEFRKIEKIITNVIHFEDVNKVDDFYQKMKTAEPGEIREVSHRVIHKDGSVRWMDVRVTPFSWNKEGYLTEIIGIARDVTVRVLQEKALAESESRFRQLADSMPQVVWTARPDGVVDYYNSRALELDGIYQVATDEWKWEPVLHQEDIEKTVNAWNNAVTTGTTYEIAHRVKMRTGEFRWYLSRGFPIRNQLGGIIKWYGTATDIHLQKEIESKLSYTLSELQRSNKDLEQFAYTASHDLQEPIRMIKSYAQLLELKYKNSLDNNAQEYLYFITEGAARMQQLVNDLLSYSRVTTTKQEFESVDVNIVLKSVLVDLKLRISEEDAIIEVDTMPRVKGDKTQIRQLFQNLIQNSLKFRSEKNPVIKIKCVQRVNDWLFSVTDNGIGIDPKYFEKIFIIFQRLHNRERYSGTGVGLAICKKIVERHNGEIYVESVINKGTTFYFTLPF